MRKMSYGTPAPDQHGAPVCDFVGGRRRRAGQGDESVGAVLARVAHDRWHCLQHDGSGAPSLAATRFRHSMPYSVEPATPCSPKLYTRRQGRSLLDRKRVGPSSDRCRSFAGWTLGKESRLAEIAAGACRPTASRPNLASGARHRNLLQEVLASIRRDLDEVRDGASANCHSACIGRRLTRLRSAEDAARSSRWERDGEGSLTLRPSVRGCANRRW